MKKITITFIEGPSIIIFGLLSTEYVTVIYLEQRSELVECLVPCGLMHMLNINRLSGVQNQNLMQLQIVLKRFAGSGYLASCVYLAGRHITSGILCTRRTLNNIAINTVYNELIYSMRSSLCMHVISSFQQLIVLWRIFVNDTKVGWSVMTTMMTRILFLLPSYLIKLGSHLLYVCMSTK